MSFKVVCTDLLDRIFLASWKAAEFTEEHESRNQEF